jgi:hypothetical protein
MADILPRLPANEGVAVSRLHLEHAVADSENGNIERAAAEVIDRTRAGLVLVQPVGERSRRRRIDCAEAARARRGDCSRLGCFAVALRTSDIATGGAVTSSHRIARLKVPGVSPSALPTQRRIGHLTYVTPSRLS